jgi:hypothetical protein
MTAIKILSVIVLGELLIHILFFFVSKIFGKDKKDKINGISIFKGVLERVFIVSSFHFNMTSALTLLGALKIATRIKDTEDKVSNDFFLVGNLISVLFGIGYYVILNDLI